jgi:hypothetical protein
LAVRFAATPFIRIAPSASTRARSTASNTVRATPADGASRACSASSWQASASAMLSAWPRKTATSFFDGEREGCGSVTVLPRTLGASAE